MIKAAKDEVLSTLFRSILQSKVYKLVARAEVSETGELHAAVSPIALNEREFVASIEGWETGVEIHR